MTLWTKVDRDFNKKKLSRFFVSLDLFQKINLVRKTKRFLLGPTLIFDMTKAKALCTY